jgi:hypothetical protein
MRRNIGIEGRSGYKNNCTHEKVNKTKEENIKTTTTGTLLKTKLRPCTTKRPASSAQLMEPVVCCRDDTTIAMT